MITVDLQGVPFDIIKLVFVISIYKGDEKEQRLGQVRNGYLRLVNGDTLHELARYEMSPDMEDKEETAMIVATLNREGPKWHITPTAEFVAGGLATIAKRYGLIIVSQ